MDLGSGIRKAIAKITGASLVDEKAVKELVKELQRVLISNDVNVKLVFELCKRIEERSLKEKQLQGFSLREHVVRVVYDELEKIMGEKYSPVQGKQRILMLGLFGQGKCVHPDTMIPLTNGEVKRAESLWELPGKEEALPGEGTVKELSSPLEVTSFDAKTLKVVKGKATHVWKLKKTEPLIKVSVRNGNAHQIITTPEHPFFTLEEGNVTQLRADSIKIGQYIALPRKILFDEDIALETQLLDNLPDDWIIEDSDLSKQVSSKLNEYGSLLVGYEKLKPPMPYCALSAELKQGKTRSWLVNRLRLNGLCWNPKEKIKVKSLKAKRWIILPLQITEELAEFLGYFYADGNAERGSIHITNESQEVNERLPLLGKTLFEIKPTVLKEKRSKNLFKTSFASITLTKYLEIVFGIKAGRKSRTMKMPKEILEAPKQIAKSFIRAYFECDGYIANNKRSIEFCTASKEFALSLRYLLLKLELHSTISEKKIKEVSYYLMRVKSCDASKFAKEISSRIGFKRDRLDKSFHIEEEQGEGVHENIPLGNMLRNTREDNGATIGEIQKYCKSFGIREKKGIISRSALRKFITCIPNLKHDNRFLLKHIERGIEAKEVHKKSGYSKEVSNAMVFRLRELGYINRTENQLQLTGEGTRYLTAAQSNVNTVGLKALSESDVLWLPVTKLEAVDNTDYVYDLTVEDHHNFVADGFFVHNTTSIGKLAKFYQNRGQSVCVIAGDVHRPAAFEQLQQLSDQVKCGFYGMKGEKNAALIAEKALAEAKDKYDVLIFDSAGRSAFDSELVKELKEVNGIFKPDEKLLVVSADLGQVAGKQAEEFNKAVGVTGVIISKMDGSGKGGGALSAVAQAKCKIAFIGIGEKVNDLELFDAQQFVSRLVGFPDLKALIEKAREVSDEQSLEKAMEEGKLDYDSFLAQMRAMKKMGPLKQIMGMMGAYDLPEEMLGKSEAKMKQFESAVLSMTPEERGEPDLMKQGKRQARVAKGAGLKPDEVKELVQNFERAHKMMKGLRGNRGFMKQLSKMMPSLGKM